MYSFQTFFLLLGWAVDGVMAVATTYVDGFYGACFGSALIVACYAALTTECTASFFDAMKDDGWDTADIDEHLTLVKLEDPIARSSARKRLRNWVSSKNGGGSSSSKSLEVKQEPSVAAHKAREDAKTKGMSEVEANEAAVSAGKSQDLMNEVIECTGGYAKAMRYCGHEGASLDKAVEGEDPETEIVKGLGDSGEFKIKALGSKCVSDDWKTMEDFYLGMAQMVSRAEADEKLYIVRRLNTISNHVHKLHAGIQLFYVKKLFKSFYKGIPQAVNQTLADTVELEWKNNLSKKSSGSSSSDSDSKMIQALKDKSKALEARLEKAERSAAAAAAKTPAKDKVINCHCCKETGHIARDCPSACPVCSKVGENGAWKHVKKANCDCD